MKNRFLLVATAVIALASCKPINHFFVEGHMDDIDDGTRLYLVRYGLDTLSTEVQNGDFSFFGRVNYPCVAYLANDVNLREASFREQLFIEKGVIDVTGTPDSLVVGGTVSNDAYRSMVLATAELMNAFYSTTDPAVQAELVNAYEAKSRAFVADNKDNIAGFDAFCDSFLDYEVEEAMEICEAFPKDIKKNPSWDRLHETLEKKLALASNAPYIDFEMPRLEDNSTPLSLSSVVKTEGNKYVLLDFWASWCGPCMGEMPHLKAAYEKYHDLGFEIFGCSFDADYDSWKGAVESKGLNWIHVSDLQYWSNAAGQLYGINSIPANYLIDCENGVIIASNLRGTAVAEKLAELLGE